MAEIFSTGAPFILMCAPMQKGSGLSGITYNRPAPLAREICGHTRKPSPLGNYHAKKRKFTEPLDSVSVEKDAFFGTKRTNLGYWLDGAQLIIGRHNADKYWYQAELLPEPLQATPANGVHREDRTSKPSLFARYSQG